jgi:hypothetical protein
MPGAEYLYTVAQIAVALIGFSGIVAAFKERGDAGLAGNEHALLSLLIERGFAALFFALLPPLLALLMSPGRVFWAVCSGLLGAYTLTAFVRLLRRRRLMSESARAAGARSFYMNSAIALGAAFGVQVLNAVGVVPNQGLGWYALGATWYLVAGANLFVSLLRVHAGDRPPRG